MGGKVYPKMAFNFLYITPYNQAHHGNCLFLELNMREACSFTI